jgi:hypothetical protein
MCKLNLVLRQPRASTVQIRTFLKSVLASRLWFRNTSSQNRVCLVGKWFPHAWEYFASITVSQLPCFKKTCLVREGVNWRFPLHSPYSSRWGAAPSETSDPERLFAIRLPPMQLWRVWILCIWGPRIHSMIPWHLHTWLWRVKLIRASWK